MNALSTAGDSLSSNFSQVDDELHNATTSLSYWSFGSYADPDGTITLRVVVQSIVIPVIASIGIVTNGLNLVVLSKVKKAKRVPIYDILLSMTAADFSVTLCAFLNSALLYLRPNPTISDDDIQRLSSAESKIYLAFDPVICFFTFISNWNTASVAALRFLAVYFPLHAAHWCTQRLVRGTIACTIVVAFLLAPLPRIIMLLVEVSELDRDAYLMFYAATNDLLPWTCSIVLVSLLLVSLRRRTANVPTMGQCPVRVQGEHRRLTVTLVLTASWFIVTTAPSTVCAVTFFSRKVGPGKAAVQLQMLYHIGQALALSNFSGNFFFYSWINKSHRKVLRQLASSFTRTLKVRLTRSAG